MSEIISAVNRRTTTKMLTESAILVALATVLSLYVVFRAPYGGSVTIGSMLPIIFISIKYPFGWAILTALAYSILQIITGGLYTPPTDTIFHFGLMVFLDYVAAFGVLCLAGPIFKSLNKNWPEKARLMVAALTCISLRFACHYLSGIIIWGYFAPAGQPAWLYSLLYNGAYMGLEFVISGTILFFAGQRILSLFMK